MSVLSSGLYLVQGAIGVSVSEVSTSGSLFSRSLIEKLPSELIPDGVLFRSPASPGAVSSYLSLHQ